MSSGDQWQAGVESRYVGPHGNAHKSGTHRAQQESSSIQPIVVTGATGFIGSAVTRALVSKGCSVRIAQRPSFAEEFFCGAPVRRMDLHDVESIRSVVDGAGLVIHLAGTGSPSSPPDRFHEIVTTNVLGTQTVLEAAVHAHVSRVVIISSSAVYGSVQAPKLHETMPVMPVSVYGTTKLAAERIASAYSASEGIETVCLRVFNVYGAEQWLPSQQTFLIPQLLQRMLLRQPILIRGSGEQTRDYVHVEDAAQAIVGAGLQERVPAPVINVGTGFPTSVNEIVGSVAERLGIAPVIERTPARPGEIQHVVADTTLLNTGLGIHLETRLSDFINEMSDDDIERYRQSAVQSGAS